MMNTPKLSQGNIGAKQYIIGHTPIDPILHIDKENPCADIKPIKYSRHPKGDSRSENALADRVTRVTILLDGGPWVQEMWLPDEEHQICILSNPGDYIAWEPGYCHTWNALGESTMLTAGFEKRR